MSKSPSPKEDTLVTIWCNQTKACSDTKTWISSLQFLKSHIWQSTYNNLYCYGKTTLYSRLRMPFLKRSLGSSKISRQADHFMQTALIRTNSSSGPFTWQQFTVYRARCNISLSRTFNTQQDIEDKIPCFLRFDWNVGMDALGVMCKIRLIRNPINRKRKDNNQHGSNPQRI